MSTIVYFTSHYSSDYMELLQPGLLGINIEVQHILADNIHWK